MADAPLTPDRLRDIANRIDRYAEIPLGNAARTDLLAIADLWAQSLLIAAARDEDFAQAVAAHWFTQGGHAEFGALHRSPQNADEIVSEILRVVRQLASRVEQEKENDPPKAWKHYARMAELEEARANKLQAQLLSTEQERDTLKRIINSDGTLTTFSEHRDILVDAMHALKSQPVDETHLTQRRRDFEAGWEAGLSHQTAEDAFAAYLTSAPS